MMRTRITLLAVAAVVWSASAQTPAERTFYFASTDAPDGIQQIATLIAAIGDIKQIKPDTKQKTLTVNGSVGQVALADWLFNELDKPANQVPLAQQSPDQAVHEYRLPGNADDVVRVFYPKYATTIQELQEAATLVRSISDIRHFYAYGAPRAITMRGTLAEAAMAEFLFNALDPAQGKRSATRIEYFNPAGHDDVVRVFFLAHVGSVQAFQEVATLMRSIGDMKRLFTYPGELAIAMRGSSDQAALTEWLTGQLDLADSPGPGTAAHVYRMSATPDDTVRVFYLQHAGTVANFQKIATYVRSTIQVRRAFTYNAARALALRGTADQIAQADELIQARDRP